MVVRLAHLSDFHLLDLAGVASWRFLGKRLLGGANLLLSRAASHRHEIAQEALRRVRELDCDHVAITGDFTNLATEPEFALARRLVDSAFPDTRRVSLVPGNHDRYTLDSWLGRWFDRAFEPYLASDLESVRRRNPGPRHDRFPFVHLRDGISVIGLDSSVPMPLFLCGGWMGGGQGEALAAALDHPAVSSERFAVVLVHHPLLPHPEKRCDATRRLYDRERLARILLRSRAGLVLSGHDHRLVCRSLARGPDLDPVLVCQAGSASALARADSSRAGGEFNVYTIEGRRLTGLEVYRHAPGRGFRLWRVHEFD